MQKKALRIITRIDWAESETERRAMHISSRFQKQNKTTDIKIMLPKSNVFSFKLDRAVEHRDDYSISNHVVEWTTINIETMVLDAFYFK